ncbi:MAG: hypothetical protein ACI977_000207 [Candidatus Nanohaloarchaea archaeon]|jgi:hypothetical protein
MRKLKLPGRDQTRPRLSEDDVELIQSLGINNIREQARGMVERYLKRPQSDKKVPTAGNPVYKAMHACNCSSRRELSRAHKIPASGQLSKRDKESIVNLLTRWIAREYNFFKEEKEVQQGELGDF